MRSPTTASEVAMRRAMLTYMNDKGNPMNPTGFLGAGCHQRRGRREVRRDHPKKAHYKREVAHRVASGGGLRWRLLAVRPPGNWLIRRYYRLRPVSFAANSGGGLFHSWFCG